MPDTNVRNAFLKFFQAARFKGSTLVLLSRSSIEPSFGEGFLDRLIPSMEAHY